MSLVSRLWKAPLAADASVAPAASKKALDGQEVSRAVAQAAVGHMVATWWRRKGTTADWTLWRGVIAERVTEGADAGFWVQYLDGPDKPRKGDLHFLPNLAEVEYATLEVLPPPASNPGTAPATSQPSQLRTRKATPQVKARVYGSEDREGDGNEEGSESFGEVTDPTSAPSIENPAYALDPVGWPLILRSDADVEALFQKLKVDFGTAGKTGAENHTILDIICTIRQNAKLLLADPALAMNPNFVAGVRQLFKRLVLFSHRKEGAHPVALKALSDAFDNLHLPAYMKEANAEAARALKVLHWSQAQISSGRSSGNRGGGGNSRRQDRRGRGGRGRGEAQAGSNE